MKLKDNTVYNQSDNHVILESYEEWDEDDDMKWILTFRLLDEYELKPDLN